MNCITAKYDCGISNQRSVGGGSRVQELGFIEKGTGQHQSNTVYCTDGVSPCLNAVNYKEPIKVVET